MKQQDTMADVMMEEFGEKYVMVLIEQEQLHWTSCQVQNS